MAQSKDQDGTVRVSLRLLALASALVALGALTTLVIVVSIKDIDALSTVALALAVLAFAVQLIVYIVQAADASRQAQQNQELHGQLMSAVAQIIERTQGTQQSVERMNGRLLEALIGKATNEGLDPNSAEFAEAVTQATVDLSEAKGRTPRTGANESPRVNYPPPLDPDVAKRLHDEMLTWPDPAEFATIRSIVGDLGEYQLSALAMHAADLLSSTQPGTPLGPGLRAGDSLLAGTNLTERAVGSPDRETLNHRGRLVARLFTAPGELPEALKDLRPKLDRARRSSRAFGNN